METIAENQNTEFELNEYQEEAVTYYGEKPLLIEAGPGSGKTRVITERVRYLVEEKEMDPESFLIITFSNKAARELKERLMDYFDVDIINQMQISTVHSFCYKLLIENTNITYKILDDDYGTKKNMFIYKNRERLGFKRESTLTRGKVKDVVAAFDKYSTFDVDTEKLVEWIKENEPVSQDYIDFVNEEYRKTGKFPRKKIDLDKKKKNLKTATDYHAYADSWYNALHLQVAKAYPIYKKLLDEHNYLDFNILQVKALEYLKENPETQYTNILVDEFQDTDPVQIEIFEILMKNALNPIEKSKDDAEEDCPPISELELDEAEISDKKITSSFTAVGDMDQSIYGFRGALENYFEYFDNKYCCKKVGLNVNYRSTNEIIEFSEQYIKMQRGKKSRKNLREARKESRNIYYIENEEREMEAASIAKIIKGLKDEEKIKNYNDVAVLLRSVLTSSKDIINVFNDENIPFQVKGLQDLENKDEIKSILTLLHFIIEDDNPQETPIITFWEADWLNLRAFTNADFKQTFIKLSSETEEILIEKQKEFEENVFNYAKLIYNDITGNRFTKRSYKGVLELEDEVLDAVFKEYPKPVLTNKTLREYGITNEDDLEFFNQLNELKFEIFGDDKDFDERPTILNVYYRILEICGFLSEDYIFDPKNKQALDYIGLFTQIIYEYENIISNRDIRGLYWFLNSNIKNYSYDIENENGVNIMTIHKSKGLEFPVVILAGLNDSSFPREYEDLRETKYKNGSAVFYTPRECLRYKSLDKDDVTLHYEEEERNIYVAMTRAQDLLILSKNFKNPKKTTYSKTLEKEIKAIELKEKISSIKDELDELMKKEDVNDLSFLLKSLNDELKDIRAELKELKPLIKDHKKIKVLNKQLKELSIEIKWKIKDLKYEDKIMDDLIDLFNLDEDSGLTRDDLKNMFLNDFDIGENNEDSDESENSFEDIINDSTIDKELDNDNTSIDSLSSNNKPIEDYFEDKEALSDILVRTENEIAGLGEDIEKSLKRTKKLLSKLKELQDDDLNDSMSEIHFKYKMEIQSIIEGAIESNEDDSLSKNQIALNALYCMLQSIESEIMENKETMESNKEILKREKELNNKKSYLDYKIKLIKDTEEFDKKYDMGYSISSYEEYKIKEDLDELSKVLMDDSVNSIGDLALLREKVLEAGSPKLCEDFIINWELIESLFNDDKFAKLELLFKIMESEEIDNIRHMSILNDRTELKEKTKLFFMLFYYKNQEIEYKEKLSFINKKKDHLGNLINAYDGIIKIEPTEIDKVIDERKIPNVIVIEDDKKLTLSYSSIQTYESCPFQYHLAYNYKFKISDREAITEGNINHNSLEEINKTIIERKDEKEGELVGEIDNELLISRDEIIKIVKRIYMESPNIDRDETPIDYVLSNIFEYWDNYGRRFDIIGSEYQFDINREDYFVLIGSIDLLYKTDNGIVILDYKTTENISKKAQEKYKKQLYTYALALKDDPMYNDAVVDKLQIYAIKSLEMLDFELNEEERDEREEKIREIASNIRNEEFHSKGYDEFSECSFCRYSFICENN
ncbi:ATP-dependent DNA helicase UvrD/REP family [Methanobrevibacter ruminantium M1]|uniref:DNA 3'-5' helicase n=1 Tax=Methanobrevibacter ruminantium (strain ATCC 35063 / DSM 1093 / JCM 13430 / OCM 146 / M1) TaxID=634498 RepID=D3E377_METRM|nr:UvrD-helicase domain-containing protein [Methanobrevibacter ruminantium]ADC46988.1 ATP-dependent DNA helicase UvrD/REP family [Methanobrevibacter ruminantium M1]